MMTVLSIIQFALGSLLGLMLLMLFVGLAQKGQSAKIERLNAEIAMMSNVVDSLSEYIRTGFDPHNQMKEARSEIERLCTELASERNHVAGLRAEIARLRDALIRIETLADEMMMGRSSYVGAIRDATRAALAEQDVDQ